MHNTKPSTLQEVGPCDVELGKKLGHVMSQLNNTSTEHASTSTILHQMLKVTEQSICLRTAKRLEEPCCVMQALVTCLLEDVVDERVHDRHGLGRNTCTSQGEYASSNFVLACRAH
jgi:hypothetical protein